MEQKNILKKSLLITVILLLVLILVFYIVNKNAFKNKTYNGDVSNFVDTKRPEKDNPVDTKYDTNIINSEYRELTDDEKLVIDNLIDRLLSYINNKEYENLYEMTTTAYRNIKFETLDDFKKYVTGIFNKNNYKCLTYKVSTDICKVTISSADAVSDTIDLYLAGYRITGYPKLYFEDIIGIRETFSELRWSDFKLDLRYSIEYSTYESAFITLVNDSNRDINVNIDKLDFVSVIAGTEDIVGIQKARSVTVPANSTTNMELSLNKKTGTIKPGYIKYKISVDGKTYEETYPISIVEDE